MISPFLGAQCLLAGLRLVLKPELRRFVWMPFLVNMVLFGLGLWFGFGQIGGLLLWLDGFLPAWLHWLSWLVVPFLVVGVVLLVFSTFTIVANLLAAPFNSLLAAEVEGFITGEKPVAEDIGGAMANELEKLFYSIKWLFLVPILFFIPVVNVVASPVWFILCAWMMAVEYADFPMANHAMGGRAVRRHLRRNWGGSLGFGVAVMVLMMVPVVNFLAMPAAVAGATVFWLKTHKQETLQF
ncbi:MAG: Sulfate transporter CysZ [Magnetococcales bacterium]|nr:Sulfate transporter CysZ [Magnetococcales bacterium]